MSTNRPIVHIADQISIEIIAFSRCRLTGTYIATIAAEYPRFVHAEIMTHRLFSRNAASSRAVPVKTLVEMVRTRPAMPTHWGKNEPGMVANEECNNPVEVSPGVLLPREEAWVFGAAQMSNLALAFDAAGYHKQIVNRLTEPFQRYRVIITATCWDNFMWLRNHKDAQPEVQKVAKGIGHLLGKVDEGLDALFGSVVAEDLAPGEWHTPFVDHIRDNHNQLVYVSQGIPVTTVEALQISSSCCGQVSYRKLDESLEKAITMYGRLVESVPVHASPFEHQATPMQKEIPCTLDAPMCDGVNTLEPGTWEKGITHRDRAGKLWSANYCGWIQYRQLIPGNVCLNYIPH